MSRLELTPIEGDMSMVTEPYQRAGICVPAGFLTDGASIPSFAWRLTYPPRHPRVIEAAVVHDYLYATHVNKTTRKQADIVFYAILLAEGVPRWKARLMHWGVRVGGARAYRTGPERLRIRKLAYDVCV
jgi:hypothetical protein